MIRTAEPTLDKADPMQILVGPKTKTPLRAQTTEMWVAMWQKPVLCVTLKGQILISVGCFVDVVRGVSVSQSIGFVSYLVLSLDAE